VHVYLREDWVRNITAQVVQEGLAHLDLSGQASNVVYRGRKGALGSKTSGHSVALCSK
jgi:hypothetical protein